jgi:hypothetical protein
MKAIKILLVLLFLALFGCASTADVLSEFDESVNFDEYTSFVICLDDLFVENTTYPEYDNNEVREIIGDAIESEMIKKGYKTNVLKPELQAGFELLLEQKEVTFTNCEIANEYNYWKECTINTEVYTEETLIIYVSDFAKNQIIWQASLLCDMNRSKGKITEYVNTLVKKMFNEFPKN